MSEITRQNGGKAAATGNDEKVFSVRALKGLNDVARLQARIMRAYLRGEISGELFKNVMYGSRCMTHTMAAIKTPAQAEDNPFGVSLFGRLDLGAVGSLGFFGVGAEESLEDYNARIMAEEATEAP